MHLERILHVHRIAHWLEPPPDFVLWFMDYLVRYLSEHGCRTLHYVDDFLFAPSPHGRPKSRADCEKSSIYIHLLMKLLCFHHLEEKDCWGSDAQCLTQIGVFFDFMQIRFEATDFKEPNALDMTSDLRRNVVVNQRLASASLVCSFCGLCMELSMGVPL